MTTSKKPQIASFPHGKLVTPEQYRAYYNPQQGFERVCSLARQRRNLEFLLATRPHRILEVGCGSMMLADMAAPLELGFDSWTIVEAEPDFAAAARSSSGANRRIEVVEGYFEANIDALRDFAPDGYDAVLISGLLHETATPMALLTGAVSLTAGGGRVLASVPNAQSFHRLLAVEAEIIPAPKTLSARDLALGHSEVFDSAGLMALMTSAGLEDLRLDGYLFKPFTNAQMELVLANADPGLIDGLIGLGHRFPEQAAEICVIGRKPR